MDVKSKSNMLTICLGIACAIMGVALIGAYAKDTRLPIVSAEHPHITNNNYHVNGQPTEQIPDMSPLPHVRSTQHVAYVQEQPQTLVLQTPEPQPQTVILQASPEPVVQHKVIYVEQPRPEPVPDTTIVIYKPETRQPVQKVVIYDERFERLKSEHELRMKEWTSGPVVVVK
jgi:hypothetical protein